MAGHVVVEEGAQALGALLVDQLGGGGEVGDQGVLGRVVGGQSVEVADDPGVQIVLRHAGEGAMAGVALQPDDARLDLAQPHRSGATRMVRLCLQMPR